MFTAQILQISLLFAFIFALSAATRRQIWEKESQNSQVRPSSRMLGCQIPFQYAVSALQYIFEDLQKYNKPKSEQVHSLRPGC